MKKIKKITLGVLSLAFLALGLYACTNDEVTTEDLTTKQTNLVAKAGEFVITTGEFYMVRKGVLVNDLKEYYKLEYRFVSEEPIPTDSVEDFESYFDSKNGRINGRIELIIDDVVEGLWIIQEGETTLVTTSSGGSSYPCTYEGLRKCTVDKIDDMNLLEKLACSFAGLGCVTKTFGNCAWENCGGESWYESQTLQPTPQV